MRRMDQGAERSPFEERVVTINRVAKVVKGGRLYHGRVKALADGAREGGLEI